MKPLHHKTHTLAKRGLSLLCILALCLGLLPATALAAEGAPATLYVGQTQITAGYWITDANGKLAAGDASNYNVYYDGNGTLTLKDATIQGRGHSSNTEPQDYGIYAATTSDQSVSLTINLIGSNTVSGYSGICVGASGGDSTLVIQSDTNGSLATSGSGWNGITISSDSGNASLTINNASVVANSEKQSGHGVSIKSKSPTELSLTVNGGSLTATGTYGIVYSSRSGTNPSTSLTVSDSALIKAIPSIYASVASIPTPKADSESGGIVFNGNSGTVYGSVTLDESLTINEGESLTIPEGSTLDTNGNLTNNGTINVEDGGKLEGEPGGTIVSAPTITTESLPAGTVNQPYTAPLTATGNNIAWSVSGDLPAGLTLDTSTGTISGTPTTVGTSTLTVKATNSAGDASKQFSLTINAVPVTSVSLNKNALSLTVGGNETLTATVEPETATDKTVTWESNNPDVAAVDQRGNVKAVASGTATINVTANDGSGQKASCTVTVTQPVTGVTLDSTELSLYTGESKTLTATVAPDNATNKAVTWESSNTEVATVDNNGKVTAVSAGTATITVTTTDGEKIATCTVNVTEPSYSITADATVLNFGSAYTGYTQPAAQTVTVENTGNQPVTLNQPSSTDSFVVGNLTDTELVAGETATFTVQPKAGLSVGTYSDTITVSDTNNNVTSSITASFTVKSRPTYNPPTVSEETTDAIADAQPGETVTVDLSSGSTKLDKEVFETLAGKDVTLVVDLGDDVSWTVKGSDIPEDADFTDIDMGVTMNSDGIPVDVVNAITGERGSVQITLAHDGAFGFTMTLTAPLGAENAGLWANLYHFDEDAGTMTFETAAPIGSDGSVSLSLSHASQYAIVIDDHNHGIVTLPFTDVSADDWFYDPVCYVYSQGLMTGTSATTFEPNTSLSRAMLVAVLHRLEGSPQASASDFIDVSDGDWYAQAVNWAASVGVVNGFDDGSFQPNTAITREQMAAILRNFAAYKGMDVTAADDLANYSDASSVSDWAKESIQWAVGSGLLGGYEDGTLRPQGTTTRAEVASVLQRALGNVAGNQ